MKKQDRGSGHLLINKGGPLKRSYLGITQCRGPNSRPSYISTARQNTVETESQGRKFEEFFWNGDSKVAGRQKLDKKGQGKRVVFVKP